MKRNALKALMVIGLAAGGVFAGVGASRVVWAQGVADAGSAGSGSSVVVPAEHVPASAGPAVQTNPGAKKAAAAAAAEAPPSDPAAEPDVGQQLQDVIKAYEAYKQAADASAKKLLLFALIAGGTQLLIILLKAATALGGTLRKWIPLVTLGLGVLVALFTSLAAGQSIMLAVLYGAAPPLSVFVNELLKMVRKPAVPPAPSGT